MNIVSTKVLKAIGALLVLLGIQAGVVSAEEIRDYYTEPGLNPFKEQINDSFAEHIDPFSGILQLKHTDIVIPGNGGMDININRVYTSLQGLQLPTHTVNGFGWTLHFGRIMVPPHAKNKICNQGQFNANTRDNPSIEWSDGSRELLALSSVLNDGSLITRSNTKAVCNTGPGGGLIVTTVDGTQYTMNKINLVRDVTSWFTTRIEDIHGNWIRIEYDQTGGVVYPVSIYRSEEGNLTPVVTFKYITTTAYSLRLENIIANGQIWQYNYEPIDANYLYPVYQLTQVTRPDNKNWLYRYNALVPDPDPNDPVLEYGPGSFSLSGLTYPDSAEIAYTYQSVQFDQALLKRTTTIHTKTVSGPGVETGIWTYAFSPYSRPETPSSAGDVNLDVTTVTSPTKKTVYSHYGLHFQAKAGSTVVYYFHPPALIGLLRYKETYSLTGTLLERRATIWDKRLMSLENHYHGEVSRVKEYLSRDTYAPILLAEYVARDPAPTSTGYTNAIRYQNHDDFGNPGKIIEVNPTTDEPDRATIYTYKNNLLQWVIGLPAKEELFAEQSIPTLIGTISRIYNNNGNLEQENKYGVITSYSYHPTGDLSSMTNANLKTTTYSHYKRGIAEKEVRPENSIITRKINPAGTVASLTNARKKTTFYQYDELNRIKLINYPLGDDVFISYATTLSNKRTLNRGKYQHVDHFDALGRLIRQSRKDTLTNETINETMKYDSLGRMTFKSYPNSTLGMSFQYDALDRVTEERNPDTTRTTYRYSNSYVYKTNALNKVTSYRYLQYGVNYQHRQVRQIGQPGSIYTLIDHNLLNQTTSIFQGQHDGTSLKGYRRKYNYDNRFYLESEYHVEIDQLNTVNNDIIYTRDNVGNMLSRKVGDTVAVKYVYDGLDRLTNIDYPTKNDVTFTYTGTNNVKTVSDISNQRTLTYDDNDNLINEQIALNGALYTVTYTINTLDFINSITYPSGRIVNYSPDALGRPTQALPYATSVTYHPTGQLHTMTYGNGQVTTSTLNTRQWIDSISAIGTQTPINLKYGYDSVGNITGITNYLAAAYNRTLFYDDLNRLDTANGIWGSTLYQYDALGNMKAGDRGSNNYIGNLLSTVDDASTTYTDITFTYDNHANITNDDRRYTITTGGVSTVHGPTYIYSYGEGDELETAKRYDAGILQETLTFGYDGDKNRVTRTQGTNTSHYIYSQGGSLLGEYTAGDITALGKEYFYLGKHQIAAVKPNQPPVVNAGPDQRAITGTLVNLNATATDQDGKRLTYAWQQTAGTIVVLTGADTATPSFTAPTVTTTDTITLQLSVTDSSNDVVTDTVNILVSTVALASINDVDIAVKDSGYSNHRSNTATTDTHTTQHNPVERKPTGVVTKRMDTKLPEPRTKMITIPTENVLIDPEQKEPTILIESQGTVIDRIEDQSEHWQNSRVIEGGA